MLERPDCGPVGGHVHVQNSAGFYDKIGKALLIRALVDHADGGRRSMFAKTRPS
jgi:hypothetical protein